MAENELDEQAFVLEVKRKIEILIPVKLPHSFVPLESQRITKSYRRDYQWLICNTNKCNQLAKRCIVILKYQYKIIAEQ